MQQFILGWLSLLFDWLSSPWVYLGPLLWWRPGQVNSALADSPYWMGLKLYTYLYLAIPLVEISFLETSSKVLNSYLFTTALREHSILNWFQASPRLLVKLFDGSCIPQKKQYFIALTISSDSESLFVATLFLLQFLKAWYSFLSFHS